MEEDFDIIKNLFEYWKIVKKRKKMIIALTFSIVLLVGIFSLMQPRKYESTTVIEIGKINNKLAIHPLQFKEFIMLTIFSKYENPEWGLNIITPDEYIYKKFNDYDSFNYLIIKVSASDQNISKKISLKIIEQSFEYVDKIINEEKDLIIEEYNESIRFSEENYKKEIENINKEIEQVNMNIDLFKKDIERLEIQINSLSSSSLSSEGISKSTLITSIIDSYKSRLLNEENKKLWLEKRLKDEKLNLEETKIFERLELENKLKDIKDSKIISGPYAKPKARGTKNKVLFAFAAALSFSILLALMLEWSKKIK